MRRFFLSLFFIILLATPVSAVVVRQTETGTATIALNGTSITATLTTTLLDTAKAFVLCSASVNDGDPEDYQITCVLTNTTTLTFTRVGIAGPAVTLRWYVAEFTSGVSVQRGTVAVNAISTTSVTLSAVTVAKAIPIISYRTAGTGFAADDLWKAKITTTTNLDLTANAVGDTSAVVAWQVVEFTAGATVHAAYDSAWITTDASKVITLSPACADDNKTWVLTTYKSDAGTLADMGQKMLRVQIAAACTTVTLDRNNTGQAMDSTTYVVEFTDGTTTQAGTEPFTTESVRNVTITAVTLARSLATGGGFWHYGGRTPRTASDNPGSGTATFALTTTTNLALTRAVTGDNADFGWSVIQFNATAAATTKSMPLTFWE